MALLVVSAAVMSVVALAISLITLARTRPAAPSFVMRRVGGTTPALASPPPMALTPARAEQAAARLAPGRAGPLARAELRSGAMCRRCGLRFDDPSHQPHE